MSKSFINDTPEEQGGWEFHRNFTIPARLAHLLKQSSTRKSGGSLKAGRGITTKDILIMWVIHSLTKVQGDENGIGCWATNGYIAEAIDAYPTYVAERINHLRRMGILLIIQVNNKRYLELEWSRTAEERASLQGEYGDAYRAEYALLCKRLNKKGGSGKHEGGFGQTRREGSGKHETTPSGKHEPNYTVDSSKRRNGKKKEGGVSRTKRPSPQDSDDFHEDQGIFSGAGRSAPPPSSLIPETSEEEQAKKWSRQLRLILRTKEPKIHVTSGTVSWNKAFTALLKDLKDIPRIQRLLDWYKDNINTVDKPTIESGPQFCARFNWLESIMEKTIGTTKIKYRDDGALMTPNMNEWHWKCPKCERYTPVHRRRCDKFDCNTWCSDKIRRSAN